MYVFNYILINYIQYKDLHRRFIVSRQYMHTYKERYVYVCRYIYTSCQFYDNGIIYEFILIIFDII